MKQSNKGLLDDIERLLNAIETCHICGGILSLDDQEPAHCENCSWDCDYHDEPECEPMHSLHHKASRALDILRVRLND